MVLIECQKCNGLLFHQGDKIVVKNNKITLIGDKDIVLEDYVCHRCTGRK